LRIALNPAEYIVGVHDPELLRGKALTPLHVKVEVGRFTSVDIDYDKLSVYNLAKR
jgi:hypothetical protein